MSHFWELLEQMSLSTIIRFLLFTIYLTYLSVSMLLFIISLFFTNLILRIFIILLFFNACTHAVLFNNDFLASKNLIENHVNRHPFQLIYDNNLCNNNCNLFSMFLN